MGSVAAVERLAVLRFFRTAMRQLSAAGRCTSGYYPSSAIHSCSSVKNALSSSGSSIFTCNSAGAASCCSTSRCISDARSPCLPSTSGPSVEPGWGHSKPGTWYGFHSTQQPRHIRTSASASGPGPSEALPASTSTQTKATRYSPLHYNVEEFAARIVPTEEERKIKSQIVEMCVGAPLNSMHAWHGTPHHANMRRQHELQLGCGLQCTTGPPCYCTVHLRRAPS